MTFSNSFSRIGATLLLAFSALGCSDDASYTSNDSSSFTPPSRPSAPATESAFYSPSGVPDAVPTNPFVIAGSDPLSTFAADVDTASYDILRQELARGVLPDPRAVRLEEYVNYFRYDYPSVSEDSHDAFTISLHAAPNPFGRDTTLLRVGIQARDATPADVARGKNLVFLVDVSGSMAQPNKLPLAQSVLLQALDLLTPTDTVSIVTYASGTAVQLPPTELAERPAIERVIAGLSAGGSTAGGAGIDLAYSQAEAAFVPGGVNTVILCTDGDFNVGPSSPAELVALIRKKRETGINLTALGFGTLPNDAVMSAMSNAGNGIYAVLTDEDQATQYVYERLLSTIHLVAKDLKIQVEFNPSEVFAYRLLGYEDRALTDAQFQNDGADAGEVGARHRVTALYELVRAGNAVPAPAGAPRVEDGAPYDGPVAVDPSELVRVALRYRDPYADADAEPFSMSQGLATSAVNDAAEVVDPDFEWALAVAEFAEILKESPHASPASLPAIEERISAFVNADDPDRGEFRTLLSKVRGLLPR